MRRAFTVVVVLWALLAPVATCAATPKSATEQQLRAAYLFNFMRYVTWPDAARPAPGAPWVIGVLDDEPFAKVLAEAVGEERIEGHALAVRTLRGGDDLPGCHVLFVGDTHRPEAIASLSTLRDRPVLAIADEAGPVPSGIVIVMFQRESKLRFSIDVDTAKRSGLTVSSKLLNLATPHESRKDGTR